MINPNMATMLCVLSTDAAVEKKDLQRALAVAVEQSFNRITVDGDMSTNDTVILLANGCGGAPLIGRARRISRASSRAQPRHAQSRADDRRGRGGRRAVSSRCSSAARRRSRTRARRRRPWPTRRSSSAPGTAAIRTGAASSMPRLQYGGRARGDDRHLLQRPDRRQRRRGQQDAAGETAGGRAERKFTVHIHLGLGAAEYVVYTTDLTPEYVRLNKGE